MMIEWRMSGDEFLDRFGGIILLGMFTLLALLLLAWNFWPELSGHDEAEHPLTREEWMERARRELIRKCEGKPDAELTEGLKAAYHEWAWTLADNYWEAEPEVYDPGIGGQPTPECVVQEELAAGL